MDQSIKSNQIKSNQINQIHQINQRERNVPNERNELLRFVFYALCI
jgi:hypothetical protein